MIPFIDLKAQQDKIRTNIDLAIKKVLDHGKYIMGPEVYALEESLSNHTGAPYAISCSSGTDALVLILMALGIKPGQAVMVPTFTFSATAEVVALLQGRCIFVDVDPNTFNLCPKHLATTLSKCHSQGIEPVGVIAVDLFGLMADYKAIKEITDQHGMWVIADSAQSFGAHSPEGKMGHMGIATATSFFPAKPLGCYGDGGAIFTHDESLMQTIKSLRVHGMGQHRYDYLRIGINGRLDTIQAAILLEKLKIYPEEVERRQAVAQRYNELLNTCFQIPQVNTGYQSVWAQYTLKAEVTEDRETFQAELKSQGIPTVVYYPKPLHTQPAYKGYVLDGQSFEVSEELAHTVFSLPMHPYVGEEVFSLLEKAVLLHEYQQPVRV